MKELAIGALIFIWFVFYIFVAKCIEASREIKPTVINKERE